MTAPGATGTDVTAPGAAGTDVTAPGAAWTESRADAAAQRILDTAELLYAEHGVDGVTMRALAGAVGCSRATLYRYFPSREAVQAAFVDRSAARLARAVARATTVGTPADRLVAAVGTALSLVRGNPAFAAWFRSDGVATAAQLAVLSPGIEALAQGFVTTLEHDTNAAGAGDGGADAGDRARWLVRVMVSLLSTPGASADEEERMLRAFVVPVIVGQPAG